MHMKSYPSLSEDHGIEALTPQDKTIYSVGISTAGVAEMRMAMSDPKRHIIATTIDRVGAEFAKKHIAEAGLLEQIEVKIEDVALPLAYPDEHFDTIYARLVLHYLTKPVLESTLKELHRILKTRGKLFVVVRSVDCTEVKDTGSTFDPNTGMTTYSLKGKSISRYFHSEDSIQKHLKAAGFQIKHVKSYEEQLCDDFQRLKPSKDIDSLIEVLAIK